MVRSLRQYGGGFANAPVVAVNPRFGAPLSKKTLQIFEELNVAYVHRPQKTKYPWFKFLNKPLALAIAEEVVTTPVVGFLDSDLLIVGEPSAFELAPNEDFLGFPVECKEMGTTGPGDPYEPLWQEFGRRIGVDIDQLPWVTTAETNERVRMYFNGGVLVYRRATGFSKSYLETTLRLLDSHVNTNAAGFGEGIKEMSAIGFSVAKLALRWRALPYSHNYNFSSATHDSWYREDRLREARIVHYHDSLWPPFFPTFMDCLAKTHPEVKAWISSLGPMHNEAPMSRRIFTRLLEQARTRSRIAYQRASVTV